MRVIRDMLVGTPPPPFDVHYNGDLAADSTTTRYRGSLVKFMDFDDVDHGTFFTFAGLTTELENIAGILEEEVSVGYLPDDAAYSTPRRKMTPIFPSSVIRAEYVQKDAAGTSNVDDSATASAASTTFTVTITTADYMIGGWVYFVTGNNSGYLHYITNNDTTTATFATAVVNAVVATDTYLVICPAQTRLLDFNATFTDIKSEIADTARANKVMGIDHWIEAPGMALTKLDRNKHDGLKIANARFYHDFTIPSPAAGGNIWVMGPALA